MQYCVVMSFLVVIVVGNLLVHMNQVIACPPARPPVITCNDWNTRYHPDLNGFHCLLKHVDQDHSTVDAVQQRQPEHSVVRHPCGPLGPTQSYRYERSWYTSHVQEPVHHSGLAKQLGLMSHRPPRGSTYHWAKDGKGFSNLCSKWGSCHIHVVKDHIQITGVRHTDEGTYSCIRVNSCHSDSPDSGMCKIQRGSTFRLTVTAAVTSSAITPSVTSAATALSMNIVSNTVTSLLQLTAGVIVITPKMSIEKLVSGSGVTTEKDNVSIEFSDANLPHQLLLPTVTNGHGHTDEDESWQTTEGPESKGNVSNTDSEYDSEDDQWSGLNFTYPAECPWCTGNCPCLKKRKRKDIKI